MIELLHCAKFLLNRSSHGRDRWFFYFSIWRPPPSTVWTVKKVEMCHRAKFHKNRLNRGRDMVDRRALKSWRDGQLNLAHGPETKKNKEKIKKRVAVKKRSRQKSVEAVREEDVKLRGVGFVKDRFQTESERKRELPVCTEWSIRRARSDGWRNR